MANYPGSESETRIEAAALERYVGALFERCGMGREDALLLSGSLVHADRRGIHSHGVLRVPEYVKKLMKDGVDPKGRPRLIRGRGAVGVVDGANAMGQIACHFAMREAISRAREHGVGVVGVRGSNHCGAMDYFAMMALPHDMVGIAVTNALPTMAPWGGKDKIVGINPLAAAFPAAQEAPLVLDIAFGETAHGKIRIYHQKGHPIPHGWAFDREGRPTTDAAAALEGLIRPIGGHKGIGMAMVTGMLSSLLSGAGYGLESGNMVDGATPGADGQLMMALDISAFEDVARFKSRVDGVIREVHGSRRANGVERLYVPGEMEADFAAAYASAGIPLNAATLADLARAAESVGLREALASRRD